MKKISFFFLILSLAIFTGCSNDDIQDPISNGEEIDVTIVADVAALVGSKTKAISPYALLSINSAKGGVNNVDPATHQLRYLLEIVDAVDPTKVIVAKQIQAVDINGTSKVTFTARLVKGITYKFVAWADFTIKATPEADNHYITSAFPAITLKAGSEKIVNDDSKDAYFASEDIKTSPTIKMTLKRPFGKVRYIATDYKQFIDAGSAVNSASQRYLGDTEQYTSFNAATGKVDPTKKIATFISISPLAIMPDVSNVGNEQTLFWDYLFAPILPDQNGAPLAFNIYCATTPTLFPRISGLVPAGIGAKAERNKLTTIRQAIFTTLSAIELDVQDDFDDFINLPTTMGAFSIGDVYFKNIGDATAGATAGDIINVSEGTVLDDFIIPAGVTVVGKGDATVMKGQITMNAKSQLVNVKSYYNGTERNAVEVKGEDGVIDGVTFITNRKRGVAPSPYNGEAVHADTSVKNLTVQNCIFNELGGVSNYWKGIYLNGNYGLKVINNTFNNINPFGIDHFNEPMIVTGNVFQRNSSLGDTQMIHIADTSIGGEGKDITFWPTGLLQNVKDIKQLNTWSGSQLTGVKCHPVRVNVYYAGGEYNATWTFNK